MIRASNGREAIVPDETLITQRVENLSQSDRQFLLSTTIVVGMDSDEVLVSDILLGAARRPAPCVERPRAIRSVGGFSRASFQFTLSYYVDDPQMDRAIYGRR